MRGVRGRGTDGRPECSPPGLSRPGGNPLFLAGLLAVSHPTWASAAQEVPEVLPEPALPGGVAAAIRWFMNVPQPIQIGGAILAAVLAIALLVFLWRRRRDIWQWLATRSRKVQAGLAVAVGVIVILAAASSYQVYDYVEHDNAFCSACHVMAPAFQRFQHSEHADLLCHDCHQQPLTASIRQLYLWVVDRPEEIGPHAPVPDAVCVDCHVVEDPTDTWQRIAATVGHRAHLESDDPDLADIMCVTCHGQEVHDFVPVDLTCGQAGCHQPAETRIVLGRMAEEAGIHCVICHEFTAIVPEEAPEALALGTLRPGEGQCLSCHDMRVLLVDFEPARDPHEAACGICHNPHVQEMPVEAFATCTEAGCHARPVEESEFHRGVHEGALPDCARCHEAHHWTLDGADCTACHPAGGVVPSRAAAEPGFRVPGFVRSAGPSWHPALGDAWNSPVGPGAGWHPSVGPDAGWHPPVAFRAGRDRQPFDHETHRDIACSRCHATERRHGEVIIGPADCFSCHHTAPVVDAGCVSCHVEGELAGPRTVPREVHLGVWDEPRDRLLPFDHAVHDGVACEECHVGRNLSADRACAACHADHHRPEADCLTCHEEARPDAHTLAVHLEGCAGAGCHEPTAEIRYGEMEKTRSFCLSCHQDQKDHEPGERCARCHLVPA